MTGTVIRAGSQTCEVTIHRPSACSGECGHQCVGCIVAKPMAVTVDNNGWHPELGEQVLVESTEKSPVSLAALLYLLPLAAGLLGYGLVVLLGGSDGLGALGGLAGLAVGFAPAIRVNHHMARSHKPSHRIVAMVEPD
ncbi:MAG: SoxR reducing system RseC family protein [Clostridia bacterium]|nr:SoxR reducing system RseC family protein [Clostridia bacterium]